MIVGGVHDALISRLKDIVWSLEQEQQATNQLVVPATVFSSSLSPLQSLVTYLKDDRQLSFNDLALRLHRSYATIYAAYKPPLHQVSPTTYTIPLSSFAQEMSVLETCVVHLKDVHALKLSVIARLLGKDPRTIWSTYDRAKKKHGTTAS